MEPSWATWGYVGASWGAHSPQDGPRRCHIGVNLDLRWSTLGHLGAMLDHLESILGHVGVMLQQNWYREASDYQNLYILMDFTSQGVGGDTAWGGRCWH
eukprot:3414236-Karenia_brevis.AAC.1